MDRSSNPFLEPDRGSGLVGWAVKQVVLWLAGAFAVYMIVANLPQFRVLGPNAVLRPVAASANGPRGAASEPRQPVGSATNQLTLRARNDGHVLLNAEVNGVPIQFLIDTGATWVSLTREDAARAGVAGGLNYSVAMTTANGVAKAAPVTLRRVRIGELEVDDVSATVLQEQGGVSLLGQSFLNRLHSYEMRDGTLTLTWQ
jgi:aspartyl protease family protein